MSILTRGLIVFTFLLSVAFSGYIFALFNTRENFQEVAVALKADLVVLSKQKKRQAEISDAQLREKNRRINELIRQNHPIAAQRTNYESQLLTLKDHIRTLEATNKQQSDQLIQSTVLQQEAGAQVVQLRGEIISIRKQRDIAEDQLNLLVDLAHREEYEKDIYRGDLKLLQIRYTKLTYDYQAANNTLAQYMDAYPVLPPGSTPRIEAKVESQDAANEVVVLNAGEERGVKEGYVFHIRRGSEYICSVEVKEVYPKYAACYIITRTKQLTTAGIFKGVSRFDDASTK